MKSLRYIKKFVENPDKNEKNALVWHASSQILEASMAAYRNYLLFMIVFITPMTIFLGGMFIALFLEEMKTPYPSLTSKELIVVSAVGLVVFLIMAGLVSFMVVEFRKTHILKLFLKNETILCKRKLYTKADLLGVFFRRNLYNESARSVLVTNPDFPDHLLFSATVGFVMKKNVVSRFHEFNRIGVALFKNIQTARQFQDILAQYFSLPRVEVDISYEGDRWER